jgi:acetyl esterase/lipase
MYYYLFLISLFFAANAQAQNETKKSHRNQNPRKEARAIKQEREGEKDKKLGKGSKIHEAVRLPMHLLRLNTSRAKTLNVSKLNYGDDKRQHILICESENVPAYRREVIFFVHGGGWHIGKPKQHILLAEILANAGYLVILPGYRLAPDVTAKEMHDDIHNALRYSLDWLETEKGWAAPRIVVGGASAGGNLGALLVFDTDALKAHDISPDVFAGFFSMSGVLDLYTMPDTKTLQRYAGDRNNDEFCESNPLFHLDGSMQLPVLCIHGNKDGLVDYETARAFADRLCQMQCELLEFHTVQDGTHLGTASQWYYKKKKDDGQSAMILRWLHRIGTSSN